MEAGIPLRRALACALVAMLVPAAAYAQNGRYKRKSVKIEVEQTEKTKGIEAKQPAAGDKAPQPEITAEGFMDIETKVQTIRDEQIEEYKQLINETDNDDPEKPDLLFRLAELFAQKQRYWRFRGMEMYTTIEKEPNAAKKKEMQRKQTNYFNEEKKWLVQAIKAYKEIADEPRYKTYPRMDESLFYYAYTLQNAKYTDDARKIYHRLIKDYPNSKYIPSAFLSFAEYFFEQGQLADAEKFYDKVLQFPKSSVYSYAMYKKGWVYLNLARWQEALEVFFKVAQITEKSKKLETLNKAAKRDFVRAYAEVGKPQLALQAFERVDKAFAMTMLQILGELYLDQGKAEKTVYVFRELIRLQPKSDKLCDWQYTVVRAINTAGTPEQRVKEIERLVELYQYVRDEKLVKGDMLDECRDNARDITGELAKVWHQEAQKTLNIDTLSYVDRLYHLYLKAFPEAEDYGAMQFYYADLIWSRAEGEKNPRVATELWESSALAFTDVVKTGKVKADQLKDAALAAVLAWKNALAVDPRTNAPPVDDKTYTEIVKPDPIPEREMKMLAAFDIYIDAVKDPKDPELPGMKFLKGRTYWRYKHYEEAVPYFEDVVKNNLTHETGPFAVQLLLDSLNHLHRYDDMLAWVDVLLEKKDFLAANEDIQERLGVIKNQSERRKAEDTEKSGKNLECGESYRAIFNRNPSAPDAAEVLYNAGVCYEKAKSIGLAISMREELIKRFPTTKLAQRALVLLGGNYGSIAFYPQAASKFEDYAKRFGGEKDASAALANAVFYRRGVGQDDIAIKDTEFYVKQYRTKNPDQAADAMFGITGIYEKRRDRAELIGHLTRYLKEWGAKGGVDRQIIAHARIGQILWEQSCPVKGVNGACISIQRERAVELRSKGKRRKREELPRQCGPESKIKLTVHERKPALVKEAQQHFRAAAALWADGNAVNKVKGKDDNDKSFRTSQMIFWVAASKFYESEEAYESFLSIKFPTKLDFSEAKPAKKKDSLKRFGAWLATKQSTLGKTRGEYMEIVEKIKGGGAHWAVASAARVGQLYQNFADALFTAEIPEDVRTGQFAEDAVDAYCDELTTAANPLEEESVKAYSFCLDESTKRSWFNEWSRLCESELGQIRPQDFPSASELHAAPTELPAIIDTNDAVSISEPPAAAAAQ